LGDDRSTWTVSFLDDDEKSIQLIRNGSGNQKTVAVTGANGFIGSHIVNLLLAKGYKVRGTVQHHKAADFLTVLPNAAKNLTLYEKDVMHDGCFDDVFQGCDCVFHLASPTLKDQREMKEPEREMIDTARVGTSNVLLSCKKNNVSTLVLTSSMCAAIPKTNVPSGGLPAILDETHWANPDFLKKKGSYYAASKTLAEKDAVEFLGKMSKDSAFRLVRICPCFTVGPMLQPTVNSSMERFARICEGKHHEQIPNRSISLVDVRDTAAHHIAAYEKGFEDRFFSLTEAWPWTLVYNALKILIPEMKCPKPLSNEIEHRPVRKYNKSRMKALGVTERSFFQVLRDAVEEIKTKRPIISLGSVQCHQISLLSRALTQFFVTHAGYYGLIPDDGSFFMIETIANFDVDMKVTHSVYFSWFFSGMKEPTNIQVEPNSQASFTGGKFTLAAYGISLTFTTSAGAYSVQGEIAGRKIKARSFNLSVPFNHFGGTYKAKDGSFVVLTFGGTNNTISYYGKSNAPHKIIKTFVYNPTKREFEHEGNNGETYQLFLNADAGHGLRVTSVRFNINNLPGTTKFYYFSSSFLSILGSVPPTGAKDLAAFAGYYPFPTVNGFVSIVGTTEGTAKEIVKVGVCLYAGGPCTVYTSFNFDSSTNTLTFPQSPNLSLKFENALTSTRPLTKVTCGQFTGWNYFTPAPLSALGSFTLHTDPDDQSEYSLQISVGNEGESLVYKKNGINVFEPTTIFGYNAVEQEALVGEYRFNLCVTADKGISCGVTTVDKSGKPTGLQSALFEFL